MFSATQTFMVTNGMRFNGILAMVLKPPRPFMILSALNEAGHSVKRTAEYRAIV